MKKNIKTLMICVFIVFMGACILYLPYLISRIPFELSTIDTREQNFAIYTELKSIIQNFINNKEIAFYSWSDFLGSSFLISKSFYGSTDIFSIISCILNLEFWDSLIIMQIIKCMIACIGMFLLLDKIKVSVHSTIIGSILYPFCASMCYFTVYPPFTTFFCIIPFFLLSLEYAMFNKRYLALTLITSFLAITNYYFFYILAFFTVIYVIFRYINHYGISFTKSEMKRMLVCTVNLLLSCFIGVLIAGFILYPMFLYVFQNERIGSGNYGLFFKDYKIYFQLISSLLLPIHAFKGLHYSFVPSSYAMYENYFWSSSLLLLILPLSMKTKDRSKKMSYFFTFISLILFFCVPFLSAFIHGLGEPSFRATIFFQILLIIIACQTLDSIEIKNRYGFHFIFIYISIIVLLFLAPTLIDKSIQLTNPQIYVVIIITLVFMIIESILLSFYRNKAIFNYLLIFVVFAELITMWKLTINRYYINDDRHSYKFMYNATHALEYKHGDLNYYLKSLSDNQSDGYFRIYFDDVSVSSGIGKNAPLFYNINSIMTYDSLYTPSLQRLVQLDSSMIKGSTHYLLITNPEVLKLVNVKYALVKNSDELPAIIEWELVENNYLGWISIYENKDYIPLGRTLEKAIKYDDMVDLSDLNKFIVCDSKDFSEISRNTSDGMVYMENIFYKNNTLIGDINATKSGFMLVTLPFDKGWSVKINEQYVKTFNINGGFIGFALPQGASKVVMYYIPNGLKEGIIISLLGIIACFVVQLLRKRGRM